MSVNPHRTHESLTLPSVPPAKSAFENLTMAPSPDAVLNEVRRNQALIGGSTGIQTGEAVRALQKDLNAWAEKTGAAKTITPTGSFDKDTEALTRSFQKWARENHPEQTWASRTDGIVGLRTMRSLDLALGRETLTDTDFQVALASQTQSVSLPRRALAELTGTFLERIKQIAKDLGHGIQPSWLMAVMDFETGGTFSSSIKNLAGSGATGLIQFMPSTARRLGTTTDALAQMSPEEQLHYVHKYLAHTLEERKRSGAETIKSAADLYMLVLYPAAFGDSPNRTLFQSGTTAYSQNRGLDHNRDGAITKKEAALKVSALAEKYSTFS